jgi:acylphosphatase
MRKSKSIARHIIVYGRVQGVGFRYFVRHWGNRLGLKGNVRNCPDSTVEILAEGDAPAMREFIKAVEKGPPVARVERLEIQDLEPSGDYSSFLIEGW